jgi:hypothetical protein
MSEHDEQVAVVKWFRLQYPKYKDCVLSIPNGSVLNKGGASMGRFKWLVAEGFKAGVSDLLFAVPINKKSGLWLEMKNIKVTRCAVTDNQWDHIHSMRRVGYCADWAAGFEAAKKIITDYMNGELDYENN